MRNKGFTLIEVLMAITVLTIAVGGIFNLLQRTLATANANQNSMTGYYLSQEGLEIVRNIRDGNWLLREDYSDVLWNRNLGAGTYEIDYGQSAPDNFSDRYLCINSSGFYGYENCLKQTNFKRMITISEEKVGEDVIGLHVTAEVAWEEKGVARSAKATEYLYNWYGYEGEALPACNCSPGYECDALGQCVEISTDVCSGIPDGDHCGECQVCQGGTCVPVSSGTDPYGDCSGEYSCSGFATRLMNTCNGFGSCDDVDEVASDCSGTCDNYCSLGSCTNIDTSADSCFVSTNEMTEGDGNGYCYDADCVWNLGYSHRKQITINGSTVGVQDYQMKLSVFRGAGTVYLNTGGTITTDGDYTIHKFANIGSAASFVAGKAGNVEYLIVGAGGGGVGGNACCVGGGGGGGGGMLTGTTAVTAGSYPVVVGAGIYQGNGGNSSFNSIVATGGGKGGNYNALAPAAGGSGGGGAYSVATGAFGIPGQGYGGGNYNTGSPDAWGAGGGGASEAGKNGGSTGNTGVGGNGLLSSISGTPTYYAGGGGGGVRANYGSFLAGAAGGSGGGGKGSDSTANNGVSGTANTGGGGGGGYGNSGGSGTTGGSGIVIIRCKTSDFTGDSGGTVYLNNEALSWPNDIRFTKSDGITLLDYWVESSDSVSSIIWVEFDSIPVEGATFYVYWGKASDSSGSNEKETFGVLNHGFEAGTFANWTPVTDLESPFIDTVKIFKNIYSGGSKIEPDSSTFRYPGFYQNIDVPSIGTPYLHFWRYRKNIESWMCHFGGLKINDVEVYGFPTGGQNDYSEYSGENWYDLSSYKGQNIKIFFGWRCQATDNGGTLRVDDVYISNQSSAISPEPAWGTWGTEE